MGMRSCDPSSSNERRSTEVSIIEIKDRPIFRSAEYLRELVRKNKPNADKSAESHPDEPPPYMPASSFMLGDEIFECEVSA